MFWEIHLGWTLMYQKKPSLSLKNFVMLKEKTPTRVFSCEIREIFKNNHFEEHLQTAASGVYYLHVYVI